MAERAASRRDASSRVEGGGNYFAAPKTDIEFISTGCTLLDLALGGGWVERKVINILGDSSSGKTLLATEAVANFVNKHPKGRVRYRDKEEAFQPSYAAALGVPVDRIDFGSETMLTVEDLHDDLQKVTAKAKTPELYVLDSLDALSDRAELERGFGENTFGANKARKMSELFRRVQSMIEKSNVTLIIISQVRADMSPFAGRGVKASGGFAVRFYRSQALYLSTKNKIVKTVRGLKKPIGINVRAVVDKNRVGLPYREAEFPILFGYGVDDVAASLDWLKQVKHLDKVGIANSTKDEDLRAIKREYTRADGKPEVPASKITAAVKKYWYEIEAQIIPTRRKYGNGNEGA